MQITIKNLFRFCAVVGVMGTTCFAIAGDDKSCDPDKIEQIANLDCPTSIYNGSALLQCKSGVRSSYCGGGGGTAVPTNDCKDQRTQFNKVLKDLDKEYKDEEKEISDDIVKAKEEISEAAADIEKAKGDMEVALSEAEEVRDRDIAELKDKTAEELKAKTSRYDELNSQITELNLAMQEASNSKTSAVRAAVRACHDQSLQQLQIYLDDRREAINRNNLAAADLHSLFSTSGKSRKDKNKDFATKYYDACIRGQSHKDQIEEIQMAYAMTVQKININIESARSEQNKIIQDVNGQEAKGKYDEGGTRILKAYEKAKLAAENAFKAAYTAANGKIESQKEQIQILEQRLLASDKDYENNRKRAAEDLMSVCADDEEGKKSAAYIEARKIKSKKSKGRSRTTGSSSSTGRQYLTPSRSSGRAN